MLAKNIDLRNKTVLVTGAAGFFGANLVLELLKHVEGIKIIGLDSMNEYYDVRLKEYRLRQIEETGGDWQFVRGNIANKQLGDDVFAAYRPDVVVNLAAQAGVRYSITNPDAYMEANIIGFYNILEACRHSYDDGAMGV